MNILTFDIEDWYNCDFISEDFNWEKHEVRIYEGVERILTELDHRHIKGTFFCLGWLAEKHPDVIRVIHNAGHHIGCHSYQHQLSFRFSDKEFKEDTYKSKSLLEDVIGVKVDAFRAPGFSITEKNFNALTILSDLGFEYDCSLFPADHDYGGFKSYGQSEPALLHLPNGKYLKEFPINIQSVYNKNIVFSGGGFFRLFPYPLIKYWGNKSDYMMTYFHPRDFDIDQPVIQDLPAIRKFKSYVGIKGAFSKFQKLLNDFDFVNVKEADRQIDWSKAKKLDIK